MRAAVVLAVALALALAACAESDPSTIEAPPSSSTTTTSAPGETGDVAVAAEEIGAFEDPVNMAAPGDGALYVVEQRGVIRAVRDGEVQREPVLDITDRVRSGGERGLLGLAFSPDRSRLYVDYTDRAGDTRLVEYPFDGRVADTSGGRELLAVDQPFGNHNGGHLVMRPDGTLWFGLGDGGSAGDPGNRAQDRSTLLGKLLRIDPRPDGERPYRIPAGNPFAGRDDARPEIWAFGLRNPWRFSFDRETGELWLADVGQNEIEEINRVPADAAGLNYGWRLCEGTRPFAADTCPADTVRPVHQYDHDGGECSVTGGFVYRGSALRGLRGAYLFGDYCDGRVLALVDEGDGYAVRDLGVRVEGLTSFGEDPDGELYVLSNGDDRVRKLVPAA